MPNIVLDAVREEQEEVNDANAINFLGPHGPRVLATPSMILGMERTCRNLLFPMLDEGDDSVGTHVDVYHLGAAPMGTQVMYRAKLQSVEGRRVIFEVSAFFEHEKIGEGTHERFMITVKRFADKLKAGRL